MQTNTPYFDPNDVQRNKGVAALAYLMLYLPLLASPESRFARFHANQALLNLLALLACAVVMIVPVLGWIIGPIASIVVSVFNIIGIVNACNGKANPMPIYGKFTIIHY